MPIKNRKLVPIFIFCAGPHTVPYARLSAESIIKTWPSEKLGDLNITVSLVAMSERDQEAAAEFIRVSFPQQITIDRSFKMGPFFLRPSTSKLRQYVTRYLFRLHRVVQNLGIPPWLAMKLLPLPPTDFLGAAHNPWISHICYRNRSFEEICIVDADLFMMDNRFYGKLSENIPENVFARGWIDRYGNIARYKDSEYIPAGSECVALNTKYFIRYNQQFLYNDPIILQRLRKQYQGISFVPGKVDSFFYESWRAQLEGLQITYPFRDLKLCHIGGFGHASFGYVKNAIEDNDRNMALFWIRRLRANHRLLSLFTVLEWDSWIVESGKAALMVSTINQVRNFPTAREMWENASLSPDETLIEEIGENLLGERWRNHSMEARLELQ